MSPRQLTVLQLVAQGQTNKEIATQLGISDKTVSNHVSRILQALKVPNRTGAAVCARQLGLICGGTDQS